MPFTPDGVASFVNSADPSSACGILLVSKPSSSQSQDSTSDAAAGNWDGQAGSDRAIPAAALADGTEVNQPFFGGKASFAGSRVLGFADNILSPDSDFDYNDVRLAVTGGGSILV